MGNVDPDRASATEPVRSTRIVAAAEAWARGHRAAWPPETIDSKPVPRPHVGAAEMRRLELELLAAVEGR